MVQIGQRFIIHRSIEVFINKKALCVFHPQPPPKGEISTYVCPPLEGVGGGLALEFFIYEKH